MLASLALLACAVACVVRAQTATIFPVGFSQDGPTGDIFGPSAQDGLTGEIVGTGAAGTTYVLDGVTSGVPITITLVEGASLLAETVSILAASIDVAVGCTISAGSAICQDVFEVGGAVSTATITVLQTVSFVPIAVLVATDGVTSAFSTSSDTSSSSTLSTMSSSASSVISSFSESSTISSVSASAITSLSSSSSTTNPTPALDSSGISSFPVLGLSMLLPMAGSLWILS